MTSRSTSLEPKFQLTLTQGENVNPCPWKETQREGKFPMKEWEKAKKERKILDQGSEENKRNMQKGFWTRQYLNNTELSPSKQNHDPKWPSPFDCQPNSCALVTFSPRTKQKQKRKRQKHSKPNFPPRKKQTIPKKMSYWSMITHVIFDLIGNDLQNQVMTYLWFRIRIKHLPVWDWYTLSDFLLSLLGPVLPLNGRLETKC